MNEESLPSTMRQLRSEVRADNTLILSLQEVPVPTPGADEVLVRMEAVPINPSDLSLLFGGADLGTARNGGTPEQPTLMVDVSTAGMKAMAGRVGKALPVGNEGAGIVVRAGSNAQGLLGKTVAISGGGMYAEYRCLHAARCMPLPSTATAKQGAAAHVNPLTALGMLETMHAEGHRALIHTAAASNLGQMLNRLCLDDGIGLVNVVRRDAQVELLRSQGAKHVVNTSSPDFMAQLIEAVAATDATLGFDAVSGGPLAGQLLVAMEAVASRNMPEYNVYGSATLKQVYVYGRLDLSPITVPASTGMSWALGGWLLPNFLQKAGPEVMGRMRERVQKELTTTFASHFEEEITLSQMLDLATAQAYVQATTGKKYLVTPASPQQ